MRVYEMGSGAKRGRMQLLLVAALFFGPLLLATWLYYMGLAWQPAGRTNHGILLQPITRLQDAGLAELGRAGNKKWLLVYVLQGPCMQACRDALYRQRQTRLMLGNDMHRLRRVFLHGAAPPDRVFAEEQHAGPTRIGDARLAERLLSLRPAEAAAGGFFLVDPLGNLVLYWPPEISPRELVDDLKHLLKLSSIG